MSEPIKNRPEIDPSVIPGATRNPGNWKNAWTLEQVQSDLIASGKPIELEVGMGRSHFLFERAALVPDRICVGIEWKERWVKQANRKIAREKITNVVAIHGNAWEVTPEIFPNNSLSGVVVNFPDPWWKKRHQKRRVLSEDFLDVLARLMKPGAFLFLQTDVATLFEEYLERVEKHPAFRNINGPFTPCANNPLIARSHREKKVTEIGVPVHRVMYERVQQNGRSANRYCGIDKCFLLLLSLESITREVMFARTDLPLGCSGFCISILSNSAGHSH